MSEGLGVTARRLAYFEFGILLRQRVDVLEDRDCEREHVGCVLLCDFFCCGVCAEIPLSAQRIRPLKELVVNDALVLEFCEPSSERLAGGLLGGESLHGSAAKHNCGRPDSMGDTLLCVLDILADSFRNAWA